MRKKYRRGLFILSTAAFMIAASTLNGQNVKWGITAAWGSDDQLCGDVATDGAGNVYMAGSFETEIAFDYANPAPGGSIIYTNTDYPSAAYTDGFLAKYDRTTHDVLWALQFTQDAPSTSRNERVAGVAVFPDGGGTGFSVFVVGSYNSAMTLPNTNTSATPVTLPAGSGQSGFIAKYNSNGELQWGYRIDASGTDVIYDVCVSADGSGGAVVYAAGSYIGSNVICQSCTLTAPGTTGGTEAFLMCFDASSGAPYWGRVMSAPGNDAYYALASAYNGDVVATGMVRGSGSIQTATFPVGVPCSGADAFIMARYNVSGALLHHYTGGGSTTGTGFYDTGLAAAIDVNGDAYIAGYFCGTCSFGSLPTVSNLGAPSTTSKDFFIAKISAAGTPLYLRGGGTANDGDAIQSIVVNNLASRVYATGNYKGNLSYDLSGTLLTPYNTGTPNIDGFLLTVNADDLTHINDESFGGLSHDDNGRAIAINAAEDIYIGSSAASLYWKIGSTNYSTNTDMAGGTNEANLFRWDHSNWPAYTNSFTTVPKGIGEWWNTSVGEWKISMVGSFHSSVGNPVSFPNCASMASTQDASGNYSTNDAYLTTCSTFGDYESFVKLMNGNGDEAVKDHITDASGNNYFTGYGPTSSTQVLSFVGGSSYSTTRLNTSFVGKYDNAGNYTWGVFLAPDNSTSSVEAEGITIDNSGNVYVTGSFSGTVTFGTQSPFTSIGPGSVDIFVAKYNSSGIFQWAKQFGSKAYEKGYSISVDNVSSYYVTGVFSGQTSDALNIGNTINGSGNDDIFVMKGLVSTGAPSNGFKWNSGGVDAGYDVISPNATECYITGKNGSQCITGSVNFFSSPTPTWYWSGTSTAGSGYVSAFGTDLVMGNNGYVLVSGYTTSTSNTLAFGALAETGVAYDAFVVSYSSWAGTPTCLNAYEIMNNTNPPSSNYMYTEGIALESGNNSPDHGDNVLVAGAKGSVPNNHEAFAHKITTEGCAVSERRPAPVVPYTVSESALYGSLVYPNPLNGIATLEIRTDADFSSTPLTVVITDMTGREVSRINGITTKLIDINAENFSDGLYYYQVMQENKMISNGKMVVHH